MTQVRTSLAVAVFMLSATIFGMNAVALQKLAFAADLFSTRSQTLAPEVVNTLFLTTGTTAIFAVGLVTFLVHAITKP